MKCLGNMIIFAVYGGFASVYQLEHGGDICQQLLQQLEPGSGSLRFPADVDGQHSTEIVSPRMLTLEKDLQLWSPVANSIRESLLVPEGTGSQLLETGRLLLHVIGFRPSRCGS